MRKLVDLQLGSGGLFWFAFRQCWSELDFFRMLPGLRGLSVEPASDGTKLRCVVPVSSDPALLFAPNELTLGGNADPALLPARSGTQRKDCNVPAEGGAPGVGCPPVPVRSDSTRV